MIFGSRDPFQIAESVTPEYEEGQSGVFGVLKKVPYPTLSHPHNPILAAWRAARIDPAGYVKAGDVSKITSWLPDATPDQIDHARRVLERLAGWAA